MEPESNLNRTPSDIAHQFLLGAAIGFLLALIALAYADLKLLSFTIYTGLFALFCGTLSAVWGKKFLTKLSMLLDAIPPFG